MNLSFSPILHSGIPDRYTFIWIDPLTRPLISDPSAPTSALTLSMASR